MGQNIRMWEAVGSSPSKAPNVILGEQGDQPPAAGCPVGSYASAAFSQHPFKIIIVKLAAAGCPVGFHASIAF